MLTHSYNNTSRSYVEKLHDLLRRDPIFLKENSFLNNEGSFNRFLENIITPQTNSIVSFSKGIEIEKYSIFETGSVFFRFDDFDAFYVACKGEENLKRYLEELGSISNICVCCVSCDMFINCLTIVILALL